MSGLVHLLRSAHGSEDAESTFCGVRRGSVAGGRAARASTHSTEVTCLRCLSTAVEHLHVRAIDAEIRARDFEQRLGEELRGRVEDCRSNLEGIERLAGMLP